MRGLEAAVRRTAWRGPHAGVAIPLLLVLAGAPAAAGMRGRPLTDVLRELRERGLNVIYTSAIVDPRLVVVTEPTATDPRKVLDEILEPVGLRARDGGSGAILIVRAMADEPTPRFVEQIVVTPGHHEIVPQDVTPRRSIEGRDVIAAPTLGSDPSRTVDLLPGIAASEVSAAFYPRGAASGNVAVMLDGLELYDPYHLSGFQRPFSVIDGRLIDAIEFTGGGLTADRGDRNGGFVEMNTVPAGEAASGQVEVGTLNSRASYAAPSRLGSVLVSGRYWYPDAASDTIVFGSDGLRSSLADLYVKAGLFASPDTVLTAQALLAADRSSLDPEDTVERVEARSESGAVWLRLLRSWPPGVTIDSVVSLGGFRRLRTGVADPDDGAVALDDERRVRYGGLRADARWTIGSLDVLRGGIEARVFAADLAYASGPPGAPSSSEVDRSGAALAAYAAYRRTLGGRTTAEAGLRWDRQTYTGYQQWSPRLNLVWQASQRNELRAAVGSYAQSMRIHELRIEDGELEYRAPEVSRQLDLSYTHRFAPRWNLRIDGYLHRVSRVLPRYENLYKPVELFPELEPDRVLLAPERASLEGIEISASGEARAALSWSASYTWSSAEDVIDGVEVPRSWDQTHAGKFLVSYRWSSGWFLAASGTVHTGWPTTPVSGTVETDADGATTIEPVAGPRNSARLPTYARLDLEAGRTFATRKGTVRVELSVLNATDRDNACCLDEVTFVPTAGGAFETQRSYDAWLGITPALQVWWTF